VSFGEDTGMDPLPRPGTGRRQKVGGVTLPHLFIQGFEERSGPIVCVLSRAMPGAVVEME